MGYKKTELNEIQCLPVHLGPTHVAALLFVVTGSGTSQYQG